MKGENCKMNISESEMMELIKNSMGKNLMGPEQIPEIDLYVDQIITLFDDQFKNKRRHENDKILTKAMVNNYSKEKLIRPIKGKKYSREQILQILLIIYLKSTLSIGDIKLVMGQLMDENCSTDNLETIIEKSRHLEEYSFEGAIAEQMGKRYGSDLETQDVVSILLEVAGLCDFLRRTAENIVDSYFSTQESHPDRGKKLSSKD